MPDVIVALAMFALIFAFITLGNWVLAVILGIVSVVMFMPTQEGIFYACILENIKFVFAKKRYTSNAKSMKENVDALIPLKDIKDSDIWNAPSTLGVDADIIDFNFQSLFANKNNVVANSQMLLVFRFALLYL